MNYEARSKVEYALEELFDNDVTSLIFCEYSRTYRKYSPVFKTDPFENSSLSNAILLCLEYNKEWNSVNAKTNSIETVSDCNRSVIDVWRHLKYYRPDLTIFEVMAEVYNLVTNELLNTFICWDIERRVLIVGEREKYANDTFVDDEFGLKFEEWNNI